MRLNFSSGEDAARMVATATIPIEPDYRASPMIWTKGLVPIATRRVYLVCSRTRAGRDSLRVYPLQKKNGLPPPLWCIVSPEHPLSTDSTSHIILRWDSMILLRPLIAILYRAKWALGREDPTFPEDLLRLVKHAFFTSVLPEGCLDEVEKDMNGIASLMELADEGRGGTESERRIACRKAIQIGRRLFGEIERRVK